MPFELEWEDTFAGPDLDRGRWLPWYLPHWSSREQAAARYALGPEGLRLRIDEDQGPWCPELDGEIRVSSLQTALVTGQHRFSPDAVVREPQPEARLYTPRFGRVELRCRATADPDAMAALWLIGLEDEPERSGELCVFELFGRDVAPGSAAVGMGIHPFGDPALADDFERVELAIDPTEPHEYAAEWEPGEARFLVDGEVVKESRQAPDYPLQLMLSLYEFRGDRPRGRYPKELVVGRVRGYRLLAA